MYSVDSAASDFSFALSIEQISQINKIKFPDLNTKTLCIQKKKLL